MKKYNIASALLLMLVLFGITSCDKFLDITPIGSVIPSTEEDFRSLMVGAYKEMPSDRGMADLRSGDMYVSKNEHDQNSYHDIEIWNESTLNKTVASFEWARYYSALMIANNVLDKKDKFEKGTPEGTNQIVGEAYMLRAYIHFTLVNLYGQPYTKPGAPQSRAIPVKQNIILDETLPRNTVEEVYKSIDSDMKEAERLINKAKWEASYNYRFSATAVQAFKSRYKLYQGKWQESLDASKKVLAVNAALVNMNDKDAKLPNLFTSPEIITAWEINPSSNILRAATVSQSLLDMYQKGDQRRSKYFSAPTDGIVKAIKGGKDEYRCTFRTGEIYLNAAEAAAHLGQTEQARTYLLTLQKNRFTPDAYPTKETEVKGMNAEQLLKEILTERVRELTFEGHRWFDLRRTTRPEIVKTFGTQKYILKADDPRYTIQIPKEAIEANPKLK
ncbi:RagB/SusD family nutrient uptake outer membrane protein [Porphyromonas pogonae]|uniref:RagB/SusD family nutrient uptake outer membrane protein n=1 Tax=Porphyromonas pogonae TaxID=867595 RepID=UPI002E7A5E5C|nr:RagB/SusD family nutrient uptake outer membrane protein [Porphyromonas pogonae]